MTYLFDPPPVVSVPVVGTDARFPVRRVFCVGRNYRDHAIEMGHDPDREPPFFFTKDARALVTDGGPFPLPRATGEVHHEVELVVALRAGGSDVAAADALGLVHGYAVGIDLTRRSLQADAKKAGRPWDTAKSFDHSGPISAIAPASAVGHPASGAIWLDVDGARRQTGDLAQMIWSVPELIAHLSGLFRLEAGDLVFTGTPAGVGPVMVGQTMRCGVEGVGELTVPVV
ncbi:fumarylacetoacetate hydrolase family protein [Chthonobacter rhizosphaerae]|uniref:fumarylacetoacetate hydrolase family protein n=1 Tax=Chthonobacter rhizosphaerae TaxID=2735553 RepID=UPI0015EF16C3|nr:fumarylacetoacetate hydrolase family protein [Chthonobacter rhizosphaerae]